MTKSLVIFVRGPFEDCDHVVVSCQFACSCWSLLMKCHLSFIPYSLEALADHLACANVDNRIKSLRANMVCLICGARNQRIFQKDSIQPTALVRQSKTLLLDLVVGDHGALGA